MDDDIPLRIAMPIPSYFVRPGGAQIGLHNLASTLAGMGHLPLVVTSYTHVKAMQKANWQPPYRVIAYPPRFLTLYRSLPGLGPWLLRRYHGFLQAAFHFDVWHATFGFPVGAAVIDYCRPRNIPHLVRCVGDDIQIRPDLDYGMRRNPRVDRKIREMLPKADCLVATTDTVMAEYDALEVASERTALIPNGVEVERFAAIRGKGGLKQELGLDDSTPLFIAVGRAHPKKNFEQIVEMAARWDVTTDGAVAFALCGAGVSVFAGMIDDAGVDDRVFLVEPQAAPGDRQPSDEVLGWYGSADGFLMPSHIETFGIVLIEAMAAGLPVIAADSPGSRDVIRGGRDGLMYDGSADGLLAAVQKLRGDAQERQRLSDLAVARAAEFDWREIAEDYLDLYEDLIERKGRRRFER